MLYSCGDIFNENIERKKKEEIQGRTKGEGLSFILRYNLSLSIYIQNMNFLCYTVAEISLKKNIERKKKRTNTGENK